jgi:hypothetical protein
MFPSERRQAAQKWTAIRLLTPTPWLRRPGVVRRARGGGHCLLIPAPRDLDRSNQIRPRPPAGCAPCTPTPACRCAVQAAMGLTHLHLVHLGEYSRVSGREKSRRGGRAPPVNTFTWFHSQDAPRTSTRSVASLLRRRPVPAPALEQGVRDRALPLSPNRATFWIKGLQEHSSDRLVPGLYEVIQCTLSLSNRDPPAGCLRGLAQLRRRRAARVPRRAREVRPCQLSGAPTPRDRCCRNVICPAVT